MTLKVKQEPHLLKGTIIVKFILAQKIPDRKRRKFLSGIFFLPPGRIGIKRR